MSYESVACFTWGLRPGFCQANRYFENPPSAADGAMGNI